MHDREEVIRRLQQNAAAEVIQQLFRRRVLLRCAMHLHSSLVVVSFIKRKFAMAQLQLHLRHPTPAPAVPAAAFSDDDINES